MVGGLRRREMEALVEERMESRMEEGRKGSTADSRRRGSEARRWKWKEGVE